MKKPPGDDDDKKIVRIEEERKKRVDRVNAKIDKKIKPHIVLGLALIKAAGPIVLTQDSIWQCRDNLWSVMSTNMARQWIDNEIEQQMRLLKMKSTKRLVDEARAWVYRSPEVYRQNIDWDMHGKIVTKSAWIDHVTGESGALSPELYATHRINCDLDPKAECPLWEQLLKDMFAQDIIDLLQEVAGMMLVSDRPKQLSKALIFWGGSNTGKTVLVNTIAGMLSEKHIGTPISLLEKPHGTSSFVTDDPWVLNEAFNQAKWHVSDVVKLVIEGENIPINQKNRDMISRIYRGAILWATNHPPAFRESTKAIIGRLIIIACTRVFDEKIPVGVGKLAVHQKLSDFILEKEKPGLLNWMLAGLQRVWKRGYYELPAEVEALLHEAHADSNMALGFMESGRMLKVKHGKVLVADFCAPFAMWWMAEKGEDSNIPSNDSIMRALRSLADPDITLGEEMRSDGRRYIGGVHLAKDALLDWEAVKSGQVMKGKLSGMSEEQSKVNKAWAARRPTKRHGND